MTRAASPEHVPTMPGSKLHLSPSREDVLDEPWTTPQGTENEIKRMHRASLPAGYPAGLSRDSRPETGSIGDDSMPMTKRTPPFRLNGGR